MSDDTLAQIVLFALAIVQIGALVWAGARRTSKPIRLVNLVLAGAAVIWWLPDIGKLVSDYYVDLVPAWVGFEFCVLIASGLAVTGIRVPGVIAWAAFAAHCCIIGLMLLYMLTFSMTMM